MAWFSSFSNIYRSQWFASLIFYLFIFEPFLWFINPSMEETREESYSKNICFMGSTWQKWNHKNIFFSQMEKNIGIKINFKAGIFSTTSSLAGALKKKKKTFQLIFLSRQFRAFFTTEKLYLKKSRLFTQKKFHTHKMRHGHRKLFSLNTFTRRKLSLSGNYFVVVSQCSRASTEAKLKSQLKIFFKTFFIHFPMQKILILNLIFVFRW